MKGRPHSILGTPMTVGKVGARALRVRKLTLFQPRFEVFVADAVP
jgi:hypothetical protein